MTNFYQFGQFIKCQKLQGSLLQTTEEGLDILEDDQRFCFLQINKDRLNPFKCSEMILNYKGKMIDQVNKMEGDLQTTEDDLQTTKDDPPSN